MHNSSPIVLVLLVIVAFFAFRAVAHEMRRRKLQQKYGDEHLVARLMRQEIWEGQTAEQLVDARGKPLQIDNKVLKTKRREIWKYNQKSKHRFGLRVTLDNGLVVGWDKKGD